MKIIHLIIALNEKKYLQRKFQKEVKKEDKGLIKFNNIIYPNNAFDVFCNKNKKICYNY